MAQDDRTEKATPKHRKRAREKGQVARSPDLGGSVVLIAGIFAISDAADLSNIGTLFAFALVSLGVIILRRTQPNRPRIFKVPLVPWFPLISIVLCGGLMTGLTVITWLRFVIWLGLGLLIYIFYSRHRSEFAKK